MESSNVKLKFKKKYVYEFIKRILDIIFSLTFLVLYGWLILFLLLIKFCEDWHNPIYTTARVG